METWNRLIGGRGEGEGGRGEWWKEGEGINRRPCVNNPWTRPVVWGLTVGAGGGLGGGGQGGTNWDNYNKINKMFKRRKIYSNQAVKKRLSES